jgi:cyclase
MGASAGTALGAQEVDAWRARFAAGEAARRSGDAESYAREMAAAAEAMPPGLLNRPFTQYHAARAAALNGRDAESVRWLRRIWEEGIESLMISFAPFDPAFERMRSSGAFRTVMALPGALELAVRALRGGVYLITGAGANIVVSKGPEGATLVDTGYAPALPALRRALADLGVERVDHLILTHPHEDHMGSAADFGDDARVVAHPGTAAAMRKAYTFIEGVTVPPKTESALPEIEIDAATEMDLGGRRVRFVPVVAHSAGDLAVYFADARVAALGDAYLGANPMMFPGTEDPDGFLDRMDAFLSGMDPATIVVGGHEEPVGLGEVRRQIRTTRAAMAFVREALAEGLTAEQTAERAAGRFPPQWVAFFHRSLGASR